MAQDFPQDWQAILDRNIPVVHRLSKPEQQQLHDLIRLFIHNKTFYGCGGLAINDEIRLTIAAQACLLLLNRPNNIYPKLRYILVYPQAFKAERNQHSEDGTVAQRSVGLLGESWGAAGKIILSWDDAIKGVSDFEDGHNVVLHEFAHQLDSATGTTNGAPALINNSYQSWAKVLSEEFHSLQRAEQLHLHTVMDYYGATNPAEFFAVATETFFEKPKQLQLKHPALFDELKTYYAVNPRDWHDS